MNTKSVRYVSEKQLSNAVNVSKRRCRIGKVIPKSVAKGRDAFRRVLVESGIAPEDQFKRKFFNDPRLDASYRVDDEGVIWDRRTGENVSEKLRALDEAQS